VTTKEVKLARIAELWAGGLITEEIARRIGATKGSVCRLARDARLGGDPRFPVRGRFDVTNRKRMPPAPKPKTNPLLIDLKINDCKWPVRSEGEHGDLHYFCANPCEAGSPYCPEHTARASARTHGATALTTWVKT
jgi:hypothetical protein